MNPRDPDRRSGFALLLSIWAFGLIAMLTLAIVAITSDRLHTSANLSAAARAEEAADGAVRMLIFDYAVDAAEGRAADQRVPVGRGPVACALPDRGAVARLTVEDESGKVDINAAGPGILAALGVGAGLKPGEAAALAAAIVSFRSQETSGRRDIEEREAYRADGRPDGPKKAPFRSVLELDQVLGMTPRLFSRLAPLVTVWSRSEIPNLSVAPPPVAALFGSFDGAAVRKGDVFLFRAQVSVPGGGRFEREAIARIFEGGPRRYRVLEWRRGYGTASPDERPGRGGAIGVVGVPPPC